MFHQRPTSANLRAYEEELKDASWLGKQLRPWVQFALFSWFGDGGEKALVGRDGWLFYKPGFRYLTERAVVPEHGSATSPQAAIVNFRDQLATRGVRLLVVVAPNKESIYPDMLSHRARSTEDVDQSTDSTTPERSFVSRRRSGGSVGGLWRIQAGSDELARGAPVSHTGQSLVARGSGVGGSQRRGRILDRDWVTAGTTDYASRPAPIARTGDLVRMLQVPQIERHTTPEDVSCRQILRRDTPTQRLYEDDPDAEVLVMGDSFLRIYEQDEPRSAGFIAHLARELRQPLTSLVNDGGASTLVRQELFRRPQLLRNKRVVVWEFVERDIRFGTEGWQPVPLPPQTAGN